MDIFLHVLFQLTLFSGLSSPVQDLQTRHIGNKVLIAERVSNIGDGLEAKMGKDGFVYVKGKLRGEHIQLRLSRKNFRDNKSVHPVIITGQIGKKQVAFQVSMRGREGFVKGRVNKQGKEWRMHVIKANARDGGEFRYQMEANNSFHSCKTKGASNSDQLFLTTNCSKLVTDL